MCLSCILRFALATLSKEHPQSPRGAHAYLMTEKHFSVLHWHPVVRQRGVCEKHEKREQPNIAWGRLRGGHVPHGRNSCLLNWVKTHMKRKLRLAKSAGQALCLAPVSGALNWNHIQGKEQVLQEDVGFFRFVPSFLGPQHQTLTTPPLERTPGTLKQKQNKVTTYSVIFVQDFWVNFVYMLQNHISIKMKAFSGLFLHSKPR